MTKSEREEVWKTARKVHQNKIDQIDEKLKALQAKREIGIKDLFTEYEKREGFEVVKESGPYQYVLGGDDRSTPWDETRTGLVLKVTTPKDLYLSTDDLYSFRVYLKITEGSDVQAIFINGRQEI